MTSLIRSRFTLVWLVLVGATAFSWETGHASGASRHYAEVAVLVVAFFKVRIVLMEFMEVRNAPTLLKVLAQGWAVAVCAALIVLYARSW